MAAGAVISSLLAGFAGNVAVFADILAGNLYLVRYIRTLITTFGVK